MQISKLIQKILQLIWSIGNHSTCKGEELNDGGAMASRYCIYDRKEKLEPLKICAPLSQMEMTGYKLFGIHIVKEVPDPIVLQPVNGGYLIVCAWGNEASDELVVNSINNQNSYSI